MSENIRPQPESKKEAPSENGANSQRSIRERLSGVRINLVNRVRLVLGYGPVDERPIEQKIDKNLR